jgi:poly(3-hydroxybutyrate) depolymerase
MKVKSKFLFILSFICFFDISFAQTFSINVGGVTRSYILHLPTGYVASTQYPLVMNFHGLGSNASQQQAYTGMDNVSNSGKFIVVYPEGISNTWNIIIGSATGTDDIGFVNTLLDTLIAKYSVNTQRIYSTGFSMGGYFTYRLGCELGSRIAAIAPVSGLIANSGSCHPSRSMPVMHIHGTADSTVKYNGAGGAEAAVNYWLTKDNCSKPGDTTHVPNTNVSDNSTADLIKYSLCNNSTEVWFYKIYNGGHTWPGAVASIAGLNTNRDFNASQEIWNFFNRPFTLPVSASPAITTQPSATTICEGSNAIFAVAASNATGYQWQVDQGTGFTNLSNTAPYSGVVTEQLNITGATAAMNGYKYRVVVSGTVSPATTSNSVTLAVNPKPSVTISANGGTAILCFEAGAVLLNSTTLLSGTPVSSGISYQWKYNGTAIIGAINPSYTATLAGNYTLTVMTLDWNCLATSTPVTITAQIPPVLTVTANGPTTFCDGGNVTLTVSSVSGLTFQWNKNGTAIPGATGMSYTASTSGKYTVTATAAGPCSTSSADVTVLVLPIADSPPPTIFSSGPTTFCEGGSVTLTLMNSAVSWQWYQDGIIIPGALSSTYTASTSGFYRVTYVTGGPCSTSIVSYPVQVTVNPIPLTPVISAMGPVTFCSGGSVILAASPAGSGGTYQWNLNGTPIPGAVNDTYTAANSGNYTVTVTNGTCSSTSSATVVSVSAISLLQPTIIPSGPVTFCMGGSVLLTVDPAEAGVLYEWYLDGVLIPQATGVSYTATASGIYTVLATGTTPCPYTINSNAISLFAVGPPCTPPPKVINGPVSVVTGQAGVSYSVIPPPNGSVYHWHLTLDAIITSATPDSSSITVTFGATTGTGEVILKESNSFGTTVNTLAVTVTAGQASGIGKFSLNNAASINPNPSAGLFNIKLDAAFEGTITLTVMNTLGEVLFTKMVVKSGSSSADYLVDLQNLSSGVYFLQIEAAKGLSIKRLIKQ